VGAAIGWLSTRLMDAPARTVVIENVMTGMFGAFIGGDFVASKFNAGVVNDAQFTVSGLVLAIGGAIVILLLLKLMRRVVGPMRNGKSKARKHD
jgi:uncharacterized membrane protein YeaQ/YmgE (transglycosylase-associated protein family)